MTEPDRDSSEPQSAKQPAKTQLSPPGVFSFVCCQQGAESCVKDEVAAQGWRLAFSRPGFVTLKHESDARDSSVSLPQGIFVRSAAWSIGKVTSNDSSSLIPAIEELLSAADLSNPQAFHLWTRDRLPVGERGFQPGAEPLTESIADTIVSALSGKGLVASASANLVARGEDQVVDVVMVEPDQWWIGQHDCESPTSRWPGGVLPINRDRDVASRAYFKTAEAIGWSGFAFQPGDHVIEIGSAPGGSSQRLLELGMKVTGIDPADMDEAITGHASFRHIRARGGDLKRRDYVGAKWLLVDSNVKPDKTLTTVENIVQNRQTLLKGLLLTLKLGSYGNATQIPEWLERVESWGFQSVRARQLATGRKEICVAAC